MKVAKSTQEPTSFVDQDFLAKCNKRASSGSSNTNNWSNHRVRHKSGPESYADLITRALKSNDQRRMTLAEIYDWLATNVPGLHEQRYLHSSKGWKNAVRHTLSINSRFRKVSRVGRPGWWTLNVDTWQKSHTQPNSPLTIQRLASVQEDLELEEFRPRRGTEPAYLLSKSSKSSINRRSLCGTPEHKNIAFDFNYGRQIIKVLQDDGTVGVVTIPGPIQLKSKMNDDVGTQTDILLEPMDRGQHFSFNITGQSYHNESMTYNRPNYSDLTRSRVKQEILFNLPDDLRDIKLDPLLNCDAMKMWTDIASGVY